MRPKFFHVYDQYTEIRGRKVPNRAICFALASVQLLVAVVALGQHIMSITVYGKVLFCNFNQTNATGLKAFYLKTDIIVFDFGFFHTLWALPKCIAEQLDGGYGRFAWCITQTFSISSFLLVAACLKRPHPQLLWPMLIQQSIYGVGLLILTLAGLPKLVAALNGDIRNPESLPLPTLGYIAGATLNFFLLYVYWHWYWHVEESHKRRRRKNVTALVLGSGGRSRLVQNGLQLRNLSAATASIVVRQQPPTTNTFAGGSSVIDGAVGVKHYSNNGRKKRNNDNNNNKAHQHVNSQHCNGDVDYTPTPRR